MSMVFTHYNPYSRKTRRKIFRGFCDRGVTVGELPTMKLKNPKSALLLLFSLACLAALPVETKAAAPADSEVIAKARANYPLKTCLVSDEPLGSMGDAVAYIHRAAGKPDRVVFFCCEGCIDDFKADPAKFLKKVDAAGKQKPAGVPAAQEKTEQQQKK
jgi:YHS domain-containing protein